MQNTKTERSSCNQTTLKIVNGLSDGTITIKMLPDKAGKQRFWLFDKESDTPVNGITPLATPGDAKMGIFLYTDQNNRKQYAIHVLPYANSNANQTWLQSSEHEHIAKTYNTVCTDDEGFIAVYVDEFVEGENLADYLAKHPEKTGAIFKILQSYIQQWEKKGLYVLDLKLDAFKIKKDGTIVLIDKDSLYQTKNHTISYKELSDNNGITPHYSPTNTDNSALYSLPDWVCFKLSMCLIETKLRQCYKEQGINPAQEIQRRRELIETGKLKEGIKDLDMSLSEMAFLANASASLFPESLQSNNQHLCQVSTNLQKGLNYYFNPYNYPPLVLKIYVILYDIKHRELSKNYTQDQRRQELLQKIKNVIAETNDIKSLLTLVKTISDNKSIALTNDLKGFLKPKTTIWSFVVSMFALFFGVETHSTYKHLQDTVLNRITTLKATPQNAIHILTNPGRGNTDKTSDADEDKQAFDNFHKEDESSELGCNNSTQINQGDGSVTATPQVSPEEQDCTHNENPQTLRTNTVI